MERVSERVDIGTNDIDGLTAFARTHDIDLTVVGPEAPLVRGIVDRFEAEDLPIVGPTAAAARLEGSKDFAKKFMDRHGIPTAEYRTFSDDEYDRARAYLHEAGAPVVVKADGLAGGKGALVCATRQEAREALETIVQNKEFGAAGDKVVIEEFMEGVEASVFALTDGEDYVVPVPSQDHKRIGEGDTGLNTGGMGAYAPAPMVTDEVLSQVRTRIIEPTLEGMAAEGYPYRGVLYCGLMLTDEGPKVVEFNARLGDPEAQVVLPLITTDWVEIFRRLVEGQLDQITLERRPGAAACVVLASEGYPTAYETGFPIKGLGEAEEEGPAIIFHAGVGTNDRGELITDGGRVMGVTGIGADLTDALARAYRAAETVEFEGKYYRSDIGKKGLEVLKRRE
jgi:phosphoribosylamine--glycine ligase